MSDDLIQVRAALENLRLAGPVTVELLAWKVDLAKRLIDSIMFAGEGMAAYLCRDGSVLTISDLGLAVHEDVILVPLYQLFIEWGFPREVFYTPLYHVMEWLDCDEDDAIAIADQLDLDELTLLTRHDYDDWVAYAAGHIPAACDSLADVLALAVALRDREEVEGDPGTPEA
ncbi:MAG TPA: hypothetical protein VER79_08755, partial [Candidatus Limnocylindrales bacterium]|nr:hypothetical protein [Candidatus Limnocylindrales bacterium]